MKNIPSEGTSRSLAYITLLTLKLASTSSLWELEPQGFAFSVCTTVGNSSPRRRSDSVPSLSLVLVLSISCTCCLSSVFFSPPDSTFVFSVLVHASLSDCPWVGYCSLPGCISVFSDLVHCSLPDFAWGEDCSISDSTFVFSGIVHSLSDFRWGGDCSPSDSTFAFSVIVHGSRSDCTWVDCLAFELASSFFLMSKLELSFEV
mmetsp:Transcript_18345/g.29848  ORF Transcript_18345/g.29848 Transcript_18345/m.29848 type:complete len:203 (-) Transcript_18345:127-735(-)